MKILLTGGAGFIGSHIAEKYISNGDELFILDKKPKSFLCPELKNKVKYFQFEFPKDNLDKLISKIKPDIINHHAALINVKESAERPVKYSQSNVLFTVKLLELAKEYHVKHFIFASSSAVYGDCINFPILELENTHPISLYGNDKLSCEYFIKLFSKDFKTTIFRYANVYGSRQNSSAEGGVVAIFSHNFINNKSSIIYGDGSQTRDLIYVKDIARVNLLATKNETTGIYNVSSNQEISILNLFDQFNKITGKNLMPVFQPRREGDIQKSLLDNSLIKQTFNWKPRFNLENGLKETIESFTKNL